MDRTVKRLICTYILETTCSLPRALRFARSRSLLMSFSHHRDFRESLQTTADSQDPPGAPQDLLGIYQGPLWGRSRDLPSVVRQFVLGTSLGYPGTTWSSRGSSGTARNSRHSPGLPPDFLWIYRALPRETYKTHHAFQQRELFGLPIRNYALASMGCRASWLCLCSRTQDHPTFPREPSLQLMQPS